MTEKIKKIIKKYILLIPVYCKSQTLKKRIFLFYTPTHTNMGDHAIRKGELMYFKKFFSEYKLIEINEKLCCKLTEKSVKKIVGKKDWIVVHGGGYIGDLWMRCEESFKRIVADFPENKIVALPNTAYYSYTESGRKLLKEDKEFYTAYKNVYFYLRDMASYNLMRNMVGENRCSYKPDMALNIKPEYKCSRKKILICTRNDREKVQSAECFEKLKKMLERNGYSVAYTDTVKSASKKFEYSQKVRDKYMEDILQEFAGARLIITDRLHGMILSAITGTPCIAMDNISKKVSGVYDWIKNLDYIRVMNFEDIDINVVEELLQKTPDYDNCNVMREFEKMAKEIKDYWES